MKAPNEPIRPRLASLVVVAAILGLAAMIWSWSFGASLPPDAGGPRIPAPAAPTGVTTTAEASGAATEPVPSRIPVALVRVRGTLLGTVAFSWSADGGPLHKPARPGSDGTFDLSTPPLSRFELHGVSASGANWVQTFRRPEALSSSDRDLDTIDGTPVAIVVDIDVRAAPEVVAALVASGQQLLRIRVTDAGAPRSPLLEHEFDLSRIDASGLLAASQSVKLVTTDAVLTAEWTFGDPAPRPHLPIASGPLVGTGGDHRRAHLDLLPECVVTGRLSWPDGAAAGGQNLVFWAPGAETDGSRVRTGEKGEFCFVIGRGNLGNIEGEGVEQAFGAAMPARRVLAGDTIDLLWPERMRFRLRDADRQPVRRFDLETAIPRAQLLRPDDQGVAFEFTAALERHPWLRVHTADGACLTFLVPAAWFAGRGEVHDLDLAMAEPTGSVEIASNERTRGVDAWTRLQLFGQGPLDGLQLQRTLSATRPWRIEGVPAGQYHAVLDRLGTKTEIAEPVTVIPCRCTAIPWPAP